MRNRRKCHKAEDGQAPNLLTDEELEERLLQLLGHPREEVAHPAARGTRVRHSDQSWASELPGGTAVVAESFGPSSGGAWEYDVVVCADTSRPPGPDNPLDRVTRWQGRDLREACDWAQTSERLTVEETLWRVLGPLPHETWTAGKTALVRSKITQLAEHYEKRLDD